VRKTALATCPACARHIRIDEPACPFCRAPLPSSFREVTAPPRPATRLSRAALYALRVGTLSVSTVACGGSLGTSGNVKDTGQDDMENSLFGVDAAYGGFFSDGALYGGLFPVDMDAKSESRADSALDTGTTDGQPDAGPTDGGGAPE
jgi:hypothetical protein